MIKKKREIQIQFKSEMGLTIRKVKPGAMTEIPSIITTILNINEECVSCACILQAVSSGFSNGETKFEEYCDTLCLAVFIKFLFI